MMDTSELHNALQRAAEEEGEVAGRLDAVVRRGQRAHVVRRAALSGLAAVAVLVAAVSLTATGHHQAPQVALHKQLAVMEGAPTPLASRTTVHGLPVALGSGQVAYLQNCPTSPTGCQRTAFGLSLNYAVGGQTVNIVVPDNTPKKLPLEIVDSGWNQANWAIIRAVDPVAEVRVHLADGRIDSARPAGGFLAFVDSGNLGMIEIYDAAGTKLAECNVPVRGTHCRLTNRSR